MITLLQGVTEKVTAKQLTDDDGEPLDPTGWTIHGVVCQYSAAGPVVATWRDTPAAGEGLAEVVDSEDPADPAGTKWVVLHCTPEVSDDWTWSRGSMQCVITAPSGDPPKEARIIDDTVILSRSCVPEE